MPPSAFGADDDLSVAPAVLEPEHFDNESELEDEQVERPAEPEETDTALLIPTSSRMSQGNDQAQVELRQTDQGQLALPVFTSVETLVTCCGENQPWVAVTVEALPKIVERAGAQGIVQDMELPSGSKAEEGN